MSAHGVKNSSYEEKVRSMERRIKLEEKYPSQGSLGT